MLKPDARSVITYTGGEVAALKRMQESIWDSEDMVIEWLKVALTAYSHYLRNSKKTDYGNFKEIRNLDFSRITGYLGY